VTGAEADADDVCQEAFVVAIERIEDCRDPAKFGRWLLQIVRNRARNLIRSQALRSYDGDGKHDRNWDLGGDLDLDDLESGTLAPDGTVTVRLDDGETELLFRQ